MAKLNLSIEPSSRGPFAPGDVVTGILHLDAEDDVEPRELKVELSWRTHGRGDRDEAVVSVDVLPCGKLARGEQRNQRFTLRLPPDAPPTRRGRLVNLDWYLRARADLAWAVDPSAETDVLVAPAEEQPAFIVEGGPFGGRPTGMSGPPPSNALAGCLTLFLLPFLVAAVANVLFGQVLVGVLFGVIPSYLLYKVVTQLVAHRFLSGTRLEVRPVVTRAADRIEVRLDVARGRIDKVAGIEGTLVCEERARYRSGTDTSTATEIVWQSPLAFAREGDGFRARLDLPLDAASTFKTRHNGVLWAVRVTPQVKGMPDPEFAAEVEVRSAPAAHAGREEQSAPSAAWLPSDQIL